MTTTKKEPEKPKMRKFKVTVEHSMWTFSSIEAARDKAKAVLDLLPWAASFTAVDE